MSTAPHAIPDAPGDVACSTKDCPHPARCAIKTKRGSGAKRGEMSSVLHYDERTAPKGATPYCKTHGIETINSLAKVLIDAG